MNRSYQSVRDVINALVLLVSMAACTATAAPPNDVADSKETRFLLYALEEFFRDTTDAGLAAWPKDTKDKTDKPERKTYFAMNSRALIARRERVIQDLMSRAREGRLGGKYNGELIELFEQYLKFLRARGEQYAKELDSCWKPLSDRHAALFGEADRNAALQRVAAAQQVLATGSYFAYQTDGDPFTTLFGMLLEGAFQNAKSQGEIAGIYKRAIDSWKDILVGPGGQSLRDEYDKQVRSVTNHFVKEVEEDLERRRAAATALATKLRSEMSWNAKQTAFLGARTPENRKVDPFFQLQQVTTETIASDAGETKQAAQYVDRAHKYIAIAGVVPSAKHKSYNFFRADFYRRAGMDANRAAELEGGSSSFSARKLTKASKLAYQAWSKFKENNDRDLTGTVLHNYIKALASYGMSVQAYDVVKSADPKLYLQTSTFYYDVARICSVGAEDVSKNLITTPPALQRTARRKVVLMLQDSSYSFERAAVFGFEDFDRARESDDLKLLRAADASILGRNRRTFDQIETASKAAQSSKD